MRIREGITVKHSCCEGRQVVGSGKEGEGEGWGAGMVHEGGERVVAVGFVGKVGDTGGKAGTGRQ